MKYTCPYKIPVANAQHTLYDIEISDEEPLKTYFDAFNQKYGFVMDNGVAKIFNFELNQFEDLASVKLFNNQKVPQGKKMVRPFNEWVDSFEYRRTYSQAYFCPRALGERDFNIWQGWAIEPMENTDDWEHEAYVEPWLNHIKKVLCSNKEDQAHYFVQWLAHLVQKPYEKPGVAIVLQSGQGFGKGLFASFLQSFVGDRYTQRVSDPSMVAGGFSGHLNNKLFVFFDEATWGGDKKSQGRLKALITEERLTIEGKHQEAYDVNHYARFVIASNSYYPVPIEHDDRRFFVPDISPERPTNDYFSHLWDLLKDEYATSVRHVLNYLLNVDLSQFKIQQFPNSDKREVLKAESAIHNDMYLSFLLAADAGEESAVILFQPDVKASMLFESFLEWKNSHPSFRAQPTSLKSFAMQMTKMGFPSSHKRTGSVYNITTIAVSTYLRSIGLQ